jgi:RHS repeat-associated protein
VSEILYAYLKTDGNTFQYEYTLRDHLGNNRVTFSDLDNDGLIETNNNEVLQESHYYPFGMTMERPSTVPTTTPKNDYLYNGKELDEDFGLNWYHYGARMYDAVIGRFTSVDPIADQFPHVSPFNYAENTPINAIDLHGLQAFFVHGTNSDIDAWASYEPLRNGIRSHFENSSIGTQELFSWSGGNNSGARTEAAYDLVDHIIANRVEGEPITVVGHSHGGNVGIDAVNMLRLEFPDAEINLITMNTPVRDDYQLSEIFANDDNFTHLNYYINTDLVQIMGGTSLSGKVFDYERGKEKGKTGTPKGYLGGTILAAILNGHPNKTGGEKGKAGRRYNNGKTQNIGNNTQYGLFDIESAHRYWLQKNADLLLNDLKMRKSEYPD